MGRAGGIGIGTLVILCLIGWALNINPLDLIEGQIGFRHRRVAATADAARSRPRGAGALRVADVLGSTVVQWKEIFAAAGKAYQAPTLVMFLGATRPACGFAQSAMGPGRESVSLLTTSSP